MYCTLLLHNGGYHCRNLCIQGDCYHSNHFVNCFLRKWSCTAPAVPATKSTSNFTHPAHASHQLTSVTTALQTLSTAQHQPACTSLQQRGTYGHTRHAHSTLCSSCSLAIHWLSNMLPLPLHTATPTAHFLCDPQWDPARWSRHTAANFKCSNISSIVFHHRKPGPCPTFSLKCEHPSYPFIRTCFSPPHS